MIRNNNPEGTGYVLITGANRGIGLALAEYFSAKGFKILGCSRSQKPLGFEGEWIEADITKPLDRINLVEQVCSYGSLCGLINNAGIGHYDQWLSTPDEVHRQVFELNYFAHVELTKTLLDSGVFRKGFIVNISSVAGIVPVACMGPYCASKFALRCFSKSLHMELKGTIHVLTAIVGRINTGFSLRALGNLKPPQTPGGGSVHALSVKIYEGVAERKNEILYPAWYRVVFCLERWLPSVYSWYNRKKWGI